MTTRAWLILALMMLPAVRGIGATPSVPDCTLYYRVRGDGKPVLLLTGGPGHAGDYLEPVFQHLSATQMAILPDQRGTGRSALQPLDTSTITVAKAVEDLERLRSALRLKQWALFGHSWGGMLAMAYTAAHPERVTDLILVGSGGVSLRSHNRIGDALERRLTPTERDSIRSIERSLPRRSDAETAVALKKLRWNAYVYDRDNLSSVCAWLTPRTYNAEVSRLMLLNLERTHYDLRKRLSANAAAGESPHSVLLAYGEADAWGLGTAEEITAAFPQSTVRVIPRSGHFPWIESPVAFYRALDAFISAN